MSKGRDLKVLLLDVETFPIKANVWGIWNQNIALNQIDEDWTIAAWAAKWLGESKIYYEDQRKARNKRHEKPILKQLWKLLDEADIIITQNGKAFDEKKIKTRFIYFGFSPPSPYQHIDTKRIAKKFGFTSNRLEYLCKVLKTKHQKLTHADFPGQSLWTECEKGNQKAWKEMEIYNKHDVFCLEDVYNKFKAWHNDNVSFAAHQDGVACEHCGSKNLVRWGYRFIKGIKYQRYLCHDCGAHLKSKKGLMKKLVHLER